MAQPFVYFLRPIGQDGPVKIGVSSKPETRLAAYLPWSPTPLEIVATLPVEKRNVEMRMHSAFRHLHLHHEWFRSAPELTAAIEAIKAGSFDIASLPRPTPLSPGKDHWTFERREGQGLTMSAHRIAWSAGVALPAETAEALQRLRDTLGPDREQDLAAVRAFIAEPLLHGEPLPHPWAVACRRKFVSKRWTRRAA